MSKKSTHAKDTGKKIYVVEDDDNIREMIKTALTSFSHEVVAFDNAEDALAAMKKDIPDLVIFDIMLPGISGLEATTQLRNDPKTKRIPVIMLTAKDTELDKVVGLDCGADDYMVKPFGVMELGARIRSMFRRTDEDGMRTPIENLETSDLLINGSTREVTHRNKPLDLTFKEYELLRMLIRERARVVPREELLSDIWGFDFIGESRTLDIHVRALRKKLGDDADNPIYIKTVRNVGYRFIGE